MTSWIMTCWIHDLLTSWLADIMTCWINDFMARWLHDLKISWLADFMICCLYDLLTSWRWLSCRPHNLMISWLHDFMTCQTPSRHPPDTLQTSSRHPPDTFQTPSRHPPDTFQTLWLYSLGWAWQYLAIHLLFRAVQQAMLPCSAGYATLFSRLCYREIDYTAKAQPSWGLGLGLSLAKFKFFSWF